MKYAQKDPPAKKIQIRIPGIPSEVVQASEGWGLSLFVIAIKNTKINVFYIYKVVEEKQAICNNLDSLSLIAPMFW